MLLCLIWVTVIVSPSESLSSFKTSSAPSPDPVLLTVAPALTASVSLTAVGAVLLACVKTLIVSPCFALLLKPTYKVLESVSTPNQSFLYFWLPSIGLELMVIFVPQFVLSFSVLNAFWLLLPCSEIVW